MTEPSSLAPHSVRTSRRKAEVHKWTDNDWKRSTPNQGKITPRLLIYLKPFREKVTEFPVSDALTTWHWFRYIRVVLTWWSLGPGNVIVILSYIFIIFCKRYDAVNHAWLWFNYHRNVANDNLKLWNHFRAVNLELLNTSDFEQLFLTRDFGRDCNPCIGAFIGVGYSVGFSFRKGVFTKSPNSVC